MGHGASTAQEKANKLFIHSEAVEGSKYLADDMSFRDSFVSFIKSGVWVEQLPTHCSFDIRSLGQVSNYLGYKTVKTASDIDKLSPKCAMRLSSKRTLSNASFSSNHSSQQYSDRGENLIVLKGVGCFCADELLSVLCCVVYPLYIASADMDDDLASFSAESMRWAPRDESLDRTQSFFKSCAHHFSDEDLIGVLSSAKWVAGPTAAFDAHHLAITICDTAADGCPIVYANKAFSNLTGHSCSHIVGKNFSILSCGETENDQVKLVQEAMCCGQAEKVAITYQTKSHRVFVDLMSIVPAGRYSLAVHLPALKDLNVEELKAVDDTLMLLHSLMSVREMAKPPSADAGTGNRSRKDSLRGSNGSCSSWLPVSLACELVSHASQVLSKSFSASSQDENRAGDPGIKLPPLQQDLEKTLELSESSLLFD